MRFVPFFVFLVLLIDPSWSGSDRLTEDGSVKVFLDVLSRPEAIPVSLSEAEFTTSYEPGSSDARISFFGILGAIAESNKFVGFTGLEFDQSIFKNLSSPRGSGTLPSSIEFTVDDFSPTSTPVTIQLITELQGNEKTFEASAVAVAGLPLRMRLDRFFLSVRGQISDTSFQRNFEIKRLRIFFKRSLVSPLTSQKIPVYFSLHTDSVLLVD